MGDWTIDGNTLRKYSGGPFFSRKEEYRWDGSSWSFYTLSEDRAPGMVVPNCEPEVMEDEHPINTRDICELLKVYGLTEKDVSLSDVPTTSPGELQKIASGKK